MGQCFIYGQNSGSANETYYWKVWSYEGMYPIVTDTDSGTVWLNYVAGGHHHGSAVFLDSIDISVEAYENQGEASLDYYLTINATIDGTEIEILDYSKESYPSYTFGAYKENIGRYKNLYFIISDVDLSSSVTVKIISQFQDQNAGFNPDMMTYVETVSSNNISAYPINDYDSNGYGYYYEFYGTKNPDEE